VVVLGSQGLDFGGERVSGTMFGAMDVVDGLVGAEEEHGFEHGKDGGAPDACTDEDEGPVVVGGRRKEEKGGDY